MAELRLAAELAPENPRFAYVLGIALNSLDEQQEALQVMRTAHASFDGDFDIAMGLATMLRDSGDTDGALERCLRSGEAPPGEPERSGAAAIAGRRTVS